MGGGKGAATTSDKVEQGMATDRARAGTIGPPEWLRHSVTKRYALPQPRHHMHTHTARSTQPTYKPMPTLNRSPTTVMTLVPEVGRVDGDTPVTMGGK